MRPRPWSEFFKQGCTLVLLGAFVLIGYFSYRGAQADDLASSYIGCRLVATGNVSHLYAHDPDDFAAVGDDEAWQDAADWGDFTSFQHPYVQTPLWAYILQPVCRVKFAAFRSLFVGAALLAFAGCLWLVARYWAPSFLSPLPMAFALLCLWFSEPFRYAMFLVQTHVLFLLLTVAALILAERRRPGWAGLLLACAATVKITPAVLVVYWLITRRWKAAASMVLWSAALTAITIATTGWPLFTVYLADLHRVSQVMLLAFNNQSFAAWSMGYVYPREVNEFNILRLPAAMRLGSMVLMLASTVVGGITDRRRRSDAQGSTPPYGALITLLAATVFAPIAWTHYFIVLAVSLMVLWHAGWQSRRLWMTVAVAVIFLLNLQPLSINMTQGTRGPYALLRSEFYAAMLCMTTLAAVGWIRLRSDRGFSLDEPGPFSDQKEAVATGGGTNF